MYIGRDFSELSMTPKNEWKENELAYYHHSFQQIMNYLTAEGQTIYKEIIKEIEARGGLSKNEGTWTSGTRIVYD
jgi:regulator of sigma D